MISDPYIIKKYIHFLILMNKNNYKLFIFNSITIQFVFAFPILRASIQVKI